MGTQAKGSRTRILYGSESTFKTIANSNPHVLPFVSETLKLSRTLIDSKTIRGDRNPTQPVRGNFDVAGDITVELDPYMGKMFYHALGTFSTSGTSPYSHTFTISDLPTSFTVEKQFLNLDIPEYFAYKGCRINSLKMSGTPEGFIETVFNMMGATTTETVAANLTYNASYDYSALAVGGAFDGFQSSLKEGGAAIGTVTKWDFTLENNIDGSVYVIDGTGGRYSLPDGMTKVSGNITVLFDSMTMYNKAMNNQESSLQITLTQGAGTGAAYNEKLDIWINELVYSPNAPVISGPQGIMVDLPFTGYYKDGIGASALRMILWNTQGAGVLQS